MGVYEIITGITKNEENLKVEIRQTEGTLERNLVYIKNTKTNRAYSFTLADGDEYGADAMTRNAVAKLHLTARDDITIYGNEAQYYVDEIHGSVYEKNYVVELARLSEYLRKAGIGVPKVTLKLNVKRRREDGMRWN